MTLTRKKKSLLGIKPNSFTMSSSVNEINSAFTQRRSPMITPSSTARPVNPFATTGQQTSQTKMNEFNVRPSVTLQENLGAQYKGRVVTTKDDDSVQLDTYTVRENPKRETVKHSVTRLVVEHTRER